jgi:hypothetical protein
MASNMDPEMMKQMSLEDMKKVMPDMMQNEGVMKNIEVIRNMSPERMRSMSREDMQKMSDEMMKNTPKEQFDQMKPRAEDMPGPFCANGNAACSDLDFSKICICNECQICKDYNLIKAKHSLYFCKDGKTN